MTRGILRAYALVMWLLVFLFFLRVLGQVLVAFFDVAFLPPMEAWYSGVILIPLIKVSTDFSRGSGFFVAPRRAMGAFLRWFSYLYFTAMLLRYGISMALHPERRWLGGTIAIVFHWVLAAFLFALGHFHTRREAPPDAPLGRTVSGAR